MCETLKMNDIYYFTKQNVSEKEYKIQSIIYNANIVNVPQPYSYDKNTKELKMRKIPNMSIADMYGEEFYRVPTIIIEKIRNIISTLYYYGLEYPDITGYNFIEYQNRVWIIDFEHAQFNKNKSTYDPFILDFINGVNSWNPQFA